ncbi:hypothetical protein BC940DRAFT_335607 [Gongronella butleri]|nr:hypothetical protein BC940DRAFT_335607 [Gongronella butleri]
MLNSNATGAGHVRTSSVISEKKYTKHLVLLKNTPTPPESGLQGVLYEADASCKRRPSGSQPLYANISRVALIQTGECDIVEKIQRVQQDGAYAAIIYSNQSATSSSDIVTVSIQPNAVGIPVFLVGRLTGLELQSSLVNATRWTNKHGISSKKDNDLDNGQTNGAAAPPKPSSRGAPGAVLMTDAVQMIRVTLFPSRSPLLEPWQFALIVVASVIVTTLVITLATHCYAFQLRNQQQQQGSVQEVPMAMDAYAVGRQPFSSQGGNNTTMMQESMDAELEAFWFQFVTTSQASNDFRRWQRHAASRCKKLPQATVDALPTRVWTSTTTSMANDDAASSNHHSICSTVKSAGSNARKKLHRTASEYAMCVICLDSYENQDVLRILPCEHEYHRDCIDLWLTKKNDTCPLCQQQVVSDQPAVPEATYDGLPETQLLTSPPLDRHGEN